MLLTLFVVSCLVFQANGRFNCPHRHIIHPCMCTTIDMLDNSLYSVVMCSGISSTRALTQVTHPFHYSIINKFVLADSFKDAPEKERKLPYQWFMTTRIQEIEIRDSYLSRSFMCNDVFTEEKSFLTHLTITNSTLSGNLCQMCPPCRSTNVSYNWMNHLLAIEHLDLSWNRLESIDRTCFEKILENLTTINLSHNKINKISDHSFKNIPNLEYLDLSYNRLKSFSRKALDQSELKLVTLDLSGNLISTLESNFFNGLNSLKVLRLRHNLFSTLSMGTWTNMHNRTQEIDLRDNFLDCDCQMQWVNKELATSLLIKATCISPKAYEDKGIRDASKSLLKLCNPKKSETGS